MASDLGERPVIGARVLAVTCAAAVAAIAVSAYADDTDVTGGTNGWLVETETSNHQHHIDPVSDGGLTYHQEAMCGSGACVGCNDNPGVPMIHVWATDAAGNVVYEWQGCPEDLPPAAEQVTVSMIANAFRRIVIPPSPLFIQPPGGKTLVNFDTNFYTEQQSLDRTVRLLGQRVDLHITVAAYTWRFDDGQKLRTSKPGAPYPHLQITHNYLQKGGYSPSLDTTYVADYRVNGGAWHTVPGSVTIEGDPERLTAVEARPVLVGYTG